DDGTLAPMGAPDPSMQVANLQSDSKILISGGLKGRPGVDRLGEMGDILRRLTGAPYTSILIRMEPMLARSFQFLVLVALLFGAANAHAGLIITEVMYYPEGGEDFEYVELYNTGAEVDLSNYRLTNGATGIDFGSLSGTLAMGETIVLFNDNLGSFSDFSWSPAPAKPIRSLAVTDWQSLNPLLDSPSLELTEIIPVDPLAPDNFAIYDFDNDWSDGWPDEQLGHSISLIDPTDVSPGNWALSDPLFGVPLLSSEDSGIGSPGYQVFPVAAPAAPEPASVAIFAVFMAASAGMRRRRSR
ncbi:lamin tail domain-containing protein, partial [Rhodopirellula sp. JC639]|uniref:lamin tail domain-containing protein n=1 Tax=Stieleria mannarensis TaxID=2755585 RepID=UPI001C717F30